MATAEKNIFWSCWQQELDHWLALAALLGAVLWLAALWNFPESLSVKKQILARSVAGSVNAVFQGVNNQVSAFGREVWSDAQLAATAGWQAFWLSGDRFAGVADEAGKLAWQLKEQKINDEKLTLAWQEIWPAPNSGQVAGASASAAGDYSEERPVGWGGSLWEQVKQVLGWH